MDDISLVAATNCVFLENKAHLGGAIRSRGGVVLSCLHCTFAENSTMADRGKPGQAAILYASGAGRSEPGILLTNSLVASGEADSVYNEPERPARIVASHSVLPTDWKDRDAVTAETNVLFTKAELSTRAGYPVLAPKSEGIGIGDWTRMMMGDAMIDISGGVRLGDERVDPGAVESN